MGKRVGRSDREHLPSPSDQASRLGDPALGDRPKCSKRRNSCERTEGRQGYERSEYAVRSPQIHYFAWIGGLTKAFSIWFAQVMRWVLGHPSRLIVFTFATMISTGTLLLMLPVSRSGAPPWPNIGSVPQAGQLFEGAAPASVALFTATSASCVTGLVVVDSGTYWSVFGQVILVLLMQSGGIGTMTIASLMAVLVSRRLGLRQRMSAAASVGAITQSDIRAVLWRITRIALSVELISAIILTFRLWQRYGFSPEKAVGHGIFLAVSAFNNAGFALRDDSLMYFVSDPWVTLPIALGIIIGGLGFPVLNELRRIGWHHRLWSLNTRLVLTGTAVLISVGTIGLAVLEWSNPKTLGPLSVPTKLLAAFFASISARTAGFNGLDIGQMTQESWLLTDFLMIIGAGPAGTAGGLKITTVLVIFAIAYTEIRGGRAVNVLGKRIGRSVHRQALTVVLLCTSLLMIALFIFMVLTPFTLSQSLFEVVSAFATVGLSTGITPAVPVNAQLVLIVLMFIGRMGPLTLATALALKSRPLLYELPKERPIIG